MLENGYLLVHSDCITALRQLPDNSVDAIVTDPPYGLRFMGKKWDYDVPGVDVWAECLRVLKPGGHLLAFAGTRTQHRMAVRIEDAGFEIRDMIAWVYGSGFPKSLDVSKAIDKASGAEREVVSEHRTGWAGTLGGKGALSGLGGSEDVRRVTATDAARQWQGWGTALKPALEPITVARKPLAGTVAANVLEHGTGALNIDGCRVPTNGEQPKGSGARESWRAMEGRTDLQPHGENITPDAGRWPANLIHDGTEPADMLGEAARFFYCAKASRADRNAGLVDPGAQFKRGATLRQVENTETKGNTHPTVKPTDLMRYLCRLVTPPGGVVLDPFMGSGSTGKAAILEGFRFIGIDMTAEYVEIARARIQYVTGEDLC